MQLLICVQKSIDLLSIFFKDSLKELTIYAKKGNQMRIYKTIQISLILILSFNIVFAAKVVQNKMNFIEFRYISPDIKVGSFEAESRKVWRVGFRYLRLEEAPDNLQKIHGLIIINAPDSYIINKYTNIAQHAVDRSPNIDVQMPVFQDAILPEKIRKLEMGHELSYFRDNRASETGLKKIDGIECNTFQLKYDNIELVLYVRTDNGKPFQLGIKTENFAYDVRYIQYKKNLKPDYKLFKVPEHFKIVDVN